MPDQESPDRTEVGHSYLDVGASSPRRWMLVVGAIGVVLALVAAFYGLYAINQSPPPTFTPDLAQTQAAAAQLHTPTVVPTLVASTPTPSAAVVITPTVEPATYTIQQGDSLIVIASRLNVNINDLTALNQISGETIFPDQVLLVPPTVTPWPDTGPFPHFVSAGETLLSIAALYQVTVEEIKNLNGLTSDTIFSGQRINIPANGVRPPTPTPTPVPWEPAVISGTLEAIYPVSAVTSHFTLHIHPDTQAARASEISRIASLVETALDHSLDALQRPFDGRFDVYVADTLFDAPHTLQRSFGESDLRRLFLLYDSSGAPPERLYFFTYALTPLVSARTLGESSSPLLREGLAVYAAGRALSSEVAAARGYLTLTQFCSAYQQTGKLPRVSRTLTFEGHLGHLDQYFAAGCFVGFLIEGEDSAKFEQVYRSGDYLAVYERTLNQIESDWITTLQETVNELPVNAAELVRVAGDVDDAYRRLWDGFEGTATQFAAYERLDRALLALFQGRLRASQAHLALYEALLNDQ